MVGGPHTKLNNLDNCQDSTISNILEDNFILFYDWGFLDRGGFFNIKIPQSGIYGGDRHVLRSVDTPNYTDGKVWEGYRENWVWESGVDGVSEQPISISGVFVEDQFYAIGNVAKPFYVDYRNGRVVFDSAIATTSKVHLEYSHKWASVIPSRGVPWFRQVQQRSFRSEKGFQVSNSGGWAMLGQTRVQLPAIAVEVVPTESLQGYQIGGGQWVNSKVIFYVITENDWECKNLIDSISYQNDRTIHLFDPTRIAMSGAMPFNYRNELNENAIPSGLYPNLVENFFYRRCWINNSRSDGISELSPDLYMGVAKCSTQVKAI